MKYDHLVKFNGVYYKPGEDVPVGEKNSSAESIAKTEAKVEEPKVEEIVEETPATKEYTKTEINRMSTAELRKLASSVGITDVDEYVGSELKVMLIDKLV